jgi:hypothetical protein
MGIRINVADEIARFADIPVTIEVHGSTIRECLNELARKFPDSRKWLFDRRGRPLFLTLVNDEAAYTTDLKRPMKTGDRLNLLMILGGG